MKESKNDVINIVSNYNSIYGGNFIPSIISIARELSKSSKVILSFPLSSKQRNWMQFLLSCDFDIEFFDSSTSKRIKKTVKEINKKRKVTIVYSHFLSALLVKSLALFNKRIKLIIHLHSDFTGGKKMPVMFYIKKYFADRIARRDALYIYDSIQQKRHSKAKFCWQVPSGISFDRVPCEQLNIQSFKKEHGIQNDDCIFLVFGWSPFIKGVDIICNALEMCLLNGKNNFKLLLVHGKDDGYDRCLKYIKEKCNYEVIKKNVIFVQPIEDVFSYFHISDVFVSSSRSEGFPYSILEALATEKPIIVSEIDATKWSFEFQSVFHYSVEDYASLSKIMLSIDNLCKEVDLIDAKEKALNKYSISIWTNSVLEVFKHLNGK